MRRHGLTILAVVASLTMLAACSSEPVLLEENVVDHVAHVEQNSAEAVAPGWTWCATLNPRSNSSWPTSGSWFELEDGATVGATVMERRDEGWTASQILEKLQAKADLCILQSETASAGESFEPLDGLADDEIGWRSETPEGRWGEYVVVQLDDWRLLGYGFSTDQDEAPIDLADLGQRAREGADRVAGSEG